MRAWNSAREFFVAVHQVTRKFPAEEKYGLTSQMRRAARSICADIAEGCGYTGGRDSLRFHRMGFGSSSECYSDIHLAREIKILSPADFDLLEGKLVPTRRELSSFIKAIENRIASGRG